MSSMFGKKVTRRHVAAASTLAFVAAGVAAAPSFAQQAQPKAKTPPNWSYEVKNGRRVPKGNRVTNPDGSWREERRDGDCVTVRQQSAEGEYRETRKCD